LWDGRFVVEHSGDGETELALRAVGADGRCTLSLSTFDRLRRLGCIASDIEALPGVWRGGVLLSTPVTGGRTQIRAWLKPKTPLAGAPFARAIVVSPDAPLI
jgi:hypothetical protein